MSDVQPIRRLRVEEPSSPIVEPVVQLAPVAVVEPPKDIDYWRSLAVATSERLAHSENLRKDLAASLEARGRTLDELRTRLEKSQARKDTAQAKINELQIELVKVSAERDQLRERIADQEVIKRKVHEYRQSLLEGPLWELFREL